MSRIAFFVLHYLVLYSVGFAPVDGILEVAQLLAESHENGGDFAADTVNFGPEMVERTALGPGLRQNFDFAKAELVVGTAVSW